MNEISKGLVPYREWQPECWDPRRAIRTFDGMIIAGVVGAGIGIAMNNHPVTAAAVSSFGAGVVGRVILALFGYED